jgi:hypothetical protein
MAGTSAAARGTGGGHKFGSTLEAEGRNLLTYFSALTFRAFDFGRGIENDLFEIFPAFFTMIFKNWHNGLLFFIISRPGGENKGEKKTPGA